jgi:hypothetical protein
MRISLAAAGASLLAAQDLEVEGGSLGSSELTVPFGPTKVPARGSPSTLGRCGKSKTVSAQCSPPLTKAQLKEVAKVGAVGLKGRGRLKGELMVKAGKVYLVTAAKGSENEVRFQLDLKASKVKATVGFAITVEGMIEKRSAWFGKITGAAIK